MRHLYVECESIETMYATQSVSSGVKVGGKTSEWVSPAAMLYAKSKKGEGVNEVLMRDSGSRVERNGNVRCPRTR